jgi:L-lactate dehydrogenase complex protein LldG
MPDLFETFKARAEAVSAEVHRFPGPAEAHAFLLDFIQEHGMAVAAPGPLLEAAGFPCEVSRETAAVADVGVSEMDWALADTGTLVQDATAVEQRLASTLPRIHVALVRGGRLLPDLASLLERVKPERASYLAFITGPSRTADIERVLTIGVHGPARLVILFVEGA